MADNLPAAAHAFILHSTLTSGPLTILGSDMVSDKGLEIGNSVSLMLDCSSEEEIRRLYYLLSEDGEAAHPLENSFWGALFGDLTDKYGNHWMLHFDRNAPGQST
jgi:PhnB protein